MIERVWLPDEESGQKELEEYEAGCREIAGRWLHPRCLDAYTMIADMIAGDVIDPEYPPAREDLADDEIVGLRHALDWAEAGVCVLQASLPLPFDDFIEYAYNDNRPAIRVIFTYAELLHLLDPAAGRAWMRILIHLSPMDNVGARSYFYDDGHSDDDY